MFVCDFRGMWLVIFVGLVGYFSWVLALRFFRYYEYPVSTKVQVITQKPIDFPAVTICNLNMYKKSYVGNDDLIKKYFWD